MSTKTHMLEVLESHRDEYLSGEYLATLLNVSRSAVWKAVKELERDGYKIMAVTNKGYCFANENDILSLPGMLPFLSPFVDRKKIIVYKSIESTNKTAKEMAAAGCQHGAVIIADHQTAGRGRYGRPFFSPADVGLYMSLILHPEDLRFDTPTTITAFAAVTVCEAIEAVSPKKPLIKWVNDVFLDEKKVGGISTEAVMDFKSGGFHWIVLGIGLNVHTRPDEFPENLRQSAASLDGGDCMAINRNRLAAEIINRLLHIEAPPEEEVFTKYKKRLLWLNEKIMVSHGDQTYAATAIGLDTDGRLIVKKGSGEISALSYGEIKIRNKIKEF